MVEREDVHEQFLSLHMSHQNRILAYLLGAVHDFHDAEDLAQQAALVLWKRFKDYDASRPYLPWALGVARNLVAKYFREMLKNGVYLPPSHFESWFVSMAHSGDDVD